MTSSLVTMCLLFTEPFSRAFSKKSSGDIAFGIVAKLRNKVCVVSEREIGNDLVVVFERGDIQVMNSGRDKVYCKQQHISF